jgi:putative membrane protein
LLFITPAELGPYAIFPGMNATLNGASAVLLLIGRGLIMRGRMAAHRAVMLTALGSSSVFLVSYLYYHYHVGSVRFQGQGWSRPVYFTILISHTILAAVIVPMVVITLSRALRERFDRHQAIARWTWPLWMYVSVTGVIVYFMLYHWFAA